MNSVTKKFEPPNIAELSKYDTPTICNAIELFNVRPPTAGYMDRRIAACFPDLPPMVGYATTATFRSAEPARKKAGDPNLSAQHLEFFASLPGPAVVVFQDLDDPPAGATFGDGMCLTYKTFGAVGLITSGAARDLDNVRALDFPCFSNGVVCGHGHCHTESINVPVSCRWHYNLPRRFTSRRLQRSHNDPAGNRPRCALRLLRISETRSNRARPTSSRKH